MRIFHFLCAFIIKMFFTLEFSETRKRKNIIDLETGKKLAITGIHTTKYGIDHIVKSGRVLYVGSTGQDEIFKRFCANPKQVHAFW